MSHQRTEGGSAKLTQPWGQMRKDAKVLHDASNQDTILIVEDLPDHALLLQRELRKAGVLNRFFVVDNGAEAIGFLGGARQFVNRARFPLPTIILLDLKLKGDVQGFDVLTWIRSRHEFDSIL